MTDFDQKLNEAWSAEVRPVQSAARIGATLDAQEEARQVVLVIHRVLLQRVGAALGTANPAACIRVTPAVVAVVAEVLRELGYSLASSLPEVLQELADVPGALVDLAGRDVAVETR